MSVRQTRLLLNVMTTLLFAVTGGVFWWAMQPPAESSAAPWTPPEPQQADAGPSQSLDAESFADLWDRPLAGPLYDPPPVDPKPAPPVQPEPEPEPEPTPLEVRLVGTIIEAGRSMAIVTDASGKIDLKQVGGVLDLEPPGIRVDQIEAETVTVSFQGAQSRLKMEETKETPEAMIDRLRQEVAE